MVRIACLHTADSNVAVFQAALEAGGLADIVLRHAVRADLLAAAEAEGGLSPALAARTAAALQVLAPHADAVLLTCSTLGPAAEHAAPQSRVPVLRVDAALAAEAVEDGGSVAVLCAAATTVEPTRRLFEAAARATGAIVAVLLVPGAWDLFKAGNQDGYLAAVAQAVRDAARAGAGRIVLAQASMAGACGLLEPGFHALNSPVSGLRAAAMAAQARRCWRNGATR